MDSGKNGQNLAICFGFRRKSPESSTKRLDPGQLTGSRPSWPESGTLLPESSDGSLTSPDSGIIFQILAPTGSGIWLVGIWL
jgi:hypothetical protein